MLMTLMMFYLNKTPKNQHKSKNNNKTTHNCRHGATETPKKATNSKNYKRAKVKVSNTNNNAQNSSEIVAAATVARRTLRHRTTIEEEEQQENLTTTRRRGRNQSISPAVVGGFGTCSAFGLSLCALLLLRLAPAVNGLAVVGVETANNANLTDLGSPATTLQPLIPYGSQQQFELLNEVAIEELKHSSREEASYVFRSHLKINSVWHSDKAQLLQVYFTDSSVSAPSKKGHKRITQTIDKIPDRPFYISVIDGKPSKVIAHTSRDQSLLNLERGIASLLQLQFKDGPVSELDVSGQCNAFYAVKSSTKIEKTKRDCSHWDLRVAYRAEKPLSVFQHSQEQVTFELSAEGTLLKAHSTETHKLALEAIPDVGSLVKSHLMLTHLALGQEEVEQLNFVTLDEAIKSLLDWYRVFDIEGDVDGAISELKNITLKDKIAASSKKLSDDHIGHESLALLFTELLPLVRITKQPEFVEILKAHKNLHSQLVDLLAAAQTIDAHNAVHEVFKYERKDDADLLEKYLQSLSVSTHPDRGIIEHLFQLLQDESVKNVKLHDSIVQTVAALTRESNFDPNDPLRQNIRAFIEEQLNEKCKEINCKTVYIRALQNLQDSRTIKTLLSYASEGDSIALSVTAMQALKSFAIVTFNAEHRKQFADIFYQLKRKYDSSARVMALDILLAMKLTKEQLGELLDYLNSNDRHFEIKTFVIQKLRMLAEKCSRFAALLQACLGERPQVNNYHVIGQKGLTTVLSRDLSQNPAYNESLLSVQEIYQGVLKRGGVELVLHAGREEFSTFKIGMFTSGLSSFVGDSDSSDSADDEGTEDTPVTAGMEISVQGILLRPLIFFNGQAELMGHVWSGTASEPTPAYQATTVAQDHEHYVILSSGATVFMRVLGARSIDLNGKVDFSLWNRNANTEIQQNVGTAVHGLMVAGFTYAKVENLFTLTSEPKISLQADIDFYSDIKLCMQLQRPEMRLNHSNTKSVYLHTSPSYEKHIRHKFTHKFTGRTLALNQKNNEMCNMIFN